MFESIFTTTSDGAISVSQSMLAMFAAVIAGTVIAVFYMLICRKESCQKNFIIGLAILPAIVSVVILLIGSNVARAFSMAGAFALVRFRSAPGSAKDISIVFFSMAAGLACGLGYVTFAAVFVMVILVVLLLFHLSGLGLKNNKRRQLRVTIPENLNYTNVFDEVFEKYTSENRLDKVKTTNMGTMFELTYDVCLKDEKEEKNFIDELRIRNGNLNIVLGMIPYNNETVLN